MDLDFTLGGVLRDFPSIKGLLGALRIMSVWREKLLVPKPYERNSANSSILKHLHSPPSDETYISFLLLNSLPLLGDVRLVTSHH